MTPAHFVDTFIIHIVEKELILDTVCFNEELFIFQLSFVQISLRWNMDDVLPETRIDLYNLCEFYSRSEAESTDHSSSMTSVIDLDGLNKRGNDDCMR